MGGQAGLFGVLTGSSPAPASSRGRSQRHDRPRERFRSGRRGRAATQGKAGVGGSQIGRQAAGSMSGGAVRQRAMRGGGETAGPRADVERVAVLKGGTSLERNVSLRSGAQAQEALSRLGHDVIAIDAGPELVAELREAEPDAAFIALHGSDGEDGTVQGLLEAIGIPYTGSGPSACVRCTDKVLAKHLMREAGIPTADFHSFRRVLVQRAGRGGRPWPMWSGASAFRWSSSRRARARRWASSSPVQARSCRGRSWARSPTTARSSSSATSRAATWLYRCSTRRPPARSPKRCPSSRRSRGRRTSTTTSLAMRSA